MFDLIDNRYGSYEDSFDTTTADYTCPNCREDWFYEGFEWYSRDGRQSLTDPELGGCCPACAMRMATDEQIIKAVMEAGYERATLSHLLGCNRIPDTEAAQDVINAVIADMPDVFADAARDVISDHGLITYLFEEMM